MRKFRCNVNGNAYDVEIEEITDGAEVSAATVAPKAASKPAPAAKPAAKKTTGAGTKVTAPMPGTILKVNVAEGDTVTKGQAIMVLEAMKMENDIPAPVDGKVTSLLVKKGDSVNSSDVLATIG